MSVISTPSRAMPRLPSPSALDGSTSEATSEVGKSDPCCVGPSLWGTLAIKTCPLSDGGWAPGIASHMADFTRSPRARLRKMRHSPSSERLLLLGAHLGGQGCCRFLTAPTAIYHAYPGLAGYVQPECWMTMEAEWLPAVQHALVSLPLDRAARKPPTKASPAPLVSTILLESNLIIG